MPADKTSRRLVKKVERMVLADLQAPLNIPTLSRTLGVSDRYLRNVFQSVHGLSTLKYLRLLKLSRARRALMSARSPTVTVTNVAKRHGFREMGRFSVEYREMFGESPSVTLRQAIREHKRRQRLDG